MQTPQCERHFGLIELIALSFSLCPWALHPLFSSLRSRALHPLFSSLRSRALHPLFSWLIAYPRRFPARHGHVIYRRGPTESGISKTHFRIHLYVIAEKLGDASWILTQELRDARYLLTQEFGYMSYFLAL